MPEYAETFDCRKCSLDAGTQFLRHSETFSLHFQDKPVTRIIMRNRECQAIRTKILALEMEVSSGLSKQGMESYWPDILKLYGNIHNTRRRSAMKFHCPS
jgi:hypothetical protein